MKISVAACELPHPEGTAAGRDLWAWCEGLRALGHDVEAWVWFRSPSSPPGPVPDWCRYEPLVRAGRWRAHVRAIFHPRQEVALAGWAPPEDAVAVADHLWSFPAVARSARSVATFHFRTVLDAKAVRQVHVSDVQMARAERVAARRAALVLTYSERLYPRLGGRRRFVPLAYPVPERPVSLVEEPVAALLADWSWPPNRRALAWLLRAWPGVRAAVPGARLLLAGRHLGTAGVGHLPGVEQLGAVASSSEVLAQAAVVAFPCPPSSGPKVKVIEAMAHGVPVVTTPAGVEGVVRRPRSGAAVSGRREFADTLAAVLSSPQTRAELAASGRAIVAEHHSPLAAAQARLAVFAESFASSSGETVAGASGDQTVVGTW